MKLAKLFGESGVAAIHLEDQLHGGKKCGHQAGKVVVPISEHVSKLLACRLQWDIMGLDVLLMGRSDAESSRLISSTIDGRDHEDILGIETDEFSPPSLAQEIISAESIGRSAAEIGALESEWLAKVKLVTFNQGEWDTCE